jgi:cell division transport system ATP-binding protein
LLEEIVKFKRVSLRYENGFEVFKDVTFTLHPGAFYFLTGLSGAGKSSLIKLMYLGYRGYRGLIQIFGKDFINIKQKEIAKFRKDIGVVFQDFYLLEHLSVLDNVALAKQIQGFSWADSRKKAKEILSWIGLGKHLDSLPETLSGGQKQRVVIARAVINRPKLLLADEPTGNLDNENALKLMILFEELNRLGTTVVIATHNRELPTSFPHSELHLDKGILKIYKPYESQRDVLYG